MRLCIVIPTLNEERALPETLRSAIAAVGAAIPPAVPAADDPTQPAERPPRCEIIVADGGSTDATRQVVERFAAAGIRWLDAPRGRGSQMNAAAAAAPDCDVLLFLHADTHLPAGAARMVQRALADPRIIGGNFLIRFAPHSPAASLFTRAYNLRSRARIFYGDSAIFVRRRVFEELGGYASERIMEDIELVRRLRRHGQLALVREGVVTTSTRRFPNGRVALKMLGLWIMLHVMMYCGVGQEAIERHYPEAR